MSERRPDLPGFFQAARNLQLISKLFSAPPPGLKTSPSRTFELEMKALAQKFLQSIFKWPRTRIWSPQTQLLTPRSNPKQELRQPKSRNGTSAGRTGSKSSLATWLGHRGSSNGQSLGKASVLQNKTGIQPGGRDRGETMMLARAAGVLHGKRTTEKKKIPSRQTKLPLRSADLSARSPL
jgi:hypothetical protein